MKALNLLGQNFTELKIADNRRHVNALLNNNVKVKFELLRVGVTSTLTKSVMLEEDEQHPAGSSISAMPTTP